MNIQEVINSMLEGVILPAQTGEGDTQQFEQWLQLFHPPEAQEESQSSGAVPDELRPPVMEEQEDMEQVMERTISAFLWTPPHETSLPDGKWDSSSESLLSLDLEEGRAELLLENTFPRFLPEESLPETWELAKGETVAPPSPEANLSIEKVIFDQPAWNLPLEFREPATSSAREEETAVPLLGQENLLSNPPASQAANVEISPPSRLEVVSPQQFMQEVRETLTVQLQKSTGTDSVQKVQIRLAPEELGQMDIQIEWGPEQAAVSITVENESIRQLIESQKDWMLNQLQQNSPIRLLTVQAAPEMTAFFVPLQSPLRERVETASLPEQQRQNGREKKKGTNRKATSREGIRHFNVYI